ncbi:MAG TPA: thiolase family protein, partial [Dehalococcoidia bacterium]
CPDDFWFGAMQQCAGRVYAMAGLGGEAVDVLQIYDNFTPTVVFSLEGFGFCPRGEGGRFVEDGKLRLGGALPANPSGGHLSESYMQGWGLNVEAVRQVRGECGPRQVPQCNVAQFLCATPCAVSIIYTR